MAKDVYGWGGGLIPKIPLYVSIPFTLIQSNRSAGP